MKIPLDRHSPKPIYRQIHDRISHLVQSGFLKPGDRLPSIRALSDEISVNKLTVIEAYNLLEADGLIHARPGAGYFVSTAAIAPPPAESGFAPSQEVVIPEQGRMSYFDIYLASTQARQEEGVINFSSGFPRPIELDDLQRIARRALKSVTKDLFHYDLPQGQQILRKQIAQLLVQQGLEVSPDHLIITNGSTQGLFLTAHHYVRPGDWVIVESPTYHGILAILQNLGARIIGIPMTQNGMNLSLLEQYLQSHRPRLIYTISTLHNPTGLTSSQSHRQQLLALATEYDCPILEDNAYEGLNFGAVPPPIKAMDESDRITYVGTFSKTLMPGLRVGYVVATGSDYSELLEQKLLYDLSAATVSQAIASEYLASGHYRRHLSHLRQGNLQSRNAMLKVLEQHFPEEASWTIPNGGLFLWVMLPQDFPIDRVCHEAIAHKVLVTSGAIFFPSQQGYPALRLNFSQTIKDIETGIAALGKLLKTHLNRSQL